MEKFRSSEFEVNKDLRCGEINAHKEFGNNIK